MGLEQKRLCPVCGADIDVWKEVFGEEHVCNLDLKRQLSDLKAMREDSNYHESTLPKPVKWNENSVY